MRILSPRKLRKAERELPFKVHLTEGRVLKNHHRCWYVESDDGRAFEINWKFNEYEEILTDQAAEAACNARLLAAAELYCKEDKD